MGTGASTLPDKFNTLSLEEKASFNEKFEALKSEGLSDEEAIAQLTKESVTNDLVVTKENKGLIKSKEIENIQVDETSIEQTAADSSSSSIPDVKIRYIHLTDLMEAIDESVTNNKTPLILDNSEDDKVNTFFNYRSAILIDGKKMGLDKSMRSIPVSEIMEDARKKVVNALKFGQTLVFALTKSVTDFHGTFNDKAAVEKHGLTLEEGKTCLPLDIFQQAGKKCVQSEFLNSIFREEELEQGVAFCRDPEKFRVVLTSAFAAEDCVEYLFGNDYGLARPDVGKALEEQYDFICIKAEQT